MYMKPWQNDNMSPLSNIAVEGMNHWKKSRLFRKKSDIRPADGWSSALLAGLVSDEAFECVGAKRRRIGWA
jgi:hypothetical protein